MGAWRYGRLNWLQQNWLRGGPRDPATAHEDNGGFYLPIPPSDVADLLDVLRGAVARHESLRTVVTFDESGTGAQAVSAPPRSVPDIEHIFELVDKEVIEQAGKRRLASAFDLRREWPVRFLVARDGRYAHGVGAVVDHSATDEWGLRVLREELLAGLGSKRPRPGAPSVGPGVTQPLDTSLWEDSPEGARRSGRALRYWRETLTSAGDRIATKATQRNGHRSGASRIHRLSSHRLHSAAAGASARFSMPIDTVFLCAFGWALAVFNDTEGAGVLGMHANRFSRAEMNSVALRFTQAPVVVCAPKAAPVGDLVRRVADQRWHSMSVGHAAPADIDAIVDEVLPEAMQTNICGALFNYTGPNFRQAPQPVGGQGGDEIVLDDAILARGPELMLRVFFNDSTANVHLISDAGSALHTHGTEFLRLVADAIHWMATGDDWTTFPRPSW